MFLMFNHLMCCRYGFFGAKGGKPGVGGAGGKGKKGGGGTFSFSSINNYWQRSLMNDLFFNHQWINFLF